MQDDRPLETGGLQQFHVVRIIEPPPSSRHVPGLSILIKIFRVCQSNVRTQKLECSVEYFPHIRQLPALKNIGPIHDDLQLRRPDLVEKPSSFVYGINRIPDFGLDTERYSVFFSDAQRLLHLYEQGCPRLRCVVVWMLSPHVA